jgi:radical SAM protein with 4Fe4S-binding SPASM domain
METRVARAGEAYAPRYVVWELTLKCDLACRHCGSRAGVARKAELSVDEAKDVARQLAEMGAREVTFIGGEAYLHPDWLAIVRATADAGIRCAMTTGARRFDAATARAAAEAGLQQVSVSVDGLEATHDRLRAVPGSWKAAIAALGHVRDAGMLPTANTQWNRLNLPEVEALGEVLLANGARLWQVQLTGPMGRAADREDWLLQPWQLLDLVPRIAAFAKAARGKGLRVHAANNLGYFGPHEGLLRGGPWSGCVAGKWTLGIESNGDVKGCPSLPSAPYVGGNLRKRSLREIWEESAELAFARDRSLDELWGRCKTCYYAEECRGGCSWTAHTLLGKRGNLPYCFHRAETLAAEGLRERLVKAAPAPGEPFDFGRYEIVEEPYSSSSSSSSSSEG